MQPTDIAWCDYSWNPVTGCTRRGPECDNCWAETLMKRQSKREDAPEYMTDEDWLPQFAEEIVSIHPTRLTEPDTYHYPEGPGKVFVVSSGDLFHHLVPEWFQRLVIARARAHPECVWICLTKRPERAAALDVQWPENVWVGTSVGSGPGGVYPNTTHRIEQLRGVDAETLWVSAEPLIEPLGEVALDHVDWMVVGGESAEKGVRREMEHEWARDLLRQCREQDVAYFFKQSSGRYPETGTELTVEVEVGDGVIYQQREIREFPPLPQVTIEARGKV